MYYLHLLILYENSRLKILLLQEVEIRSEKEHNIQPLKLNSQVVK